MVKGFWIKIELSEERKEGASGLPGGAGSHCS